MSGSDGVPKPPKLNSSSDFIKWRRLLFALIRRDDVYVEGLKDRPEDVPAAATRRWEERNARAKSTITLYLGDAPLAQLSEIVDDEESNAKDLWEAVAKLYTSSNSQAVINLQRELESLSLTDTSQWERHLQKFHEILGKIAAYGVAITEEEKSSKLLRTLPESFAPLAMVAESSGMTFDRIIATVESEISRRDKRSGTPKPIPIPKANTMREAGPLRDTDKRSNKKCWICNRRGHFARDCREKGFSQHGRGRGRRGGRGGRGRGHLAQRNVWQGEQGRGNFNHRPTAGFGGPWSNAQPMADAPPCHLQGQHHHANHQRMPPSYGTGPNPHRKSSHEKYFGLMAKVKFRSSVATVDDVRSDDMLVDSGGTHHFFHKQSLFRNYRRVDDRSVLSASGMATIIGMGEVNLKDFGIVVEAYHVPSF